VTINQKHSAIIACAALALTASAPATSLAAQSVKVSDEGKLHKAGYSGSLIREEGAATGTLPGKLRVEFRYTGTSLTVTAQFTITGNGWSLTGDGKGTLSNPNSPSPSFRGPLSITGGSGRYAHARGNGELFGVIYRRNQFALTVQTLGELHY
jgi:hypothetical protein